MASTARSTARRSSSSTAPGSTRPAEAVDLVKQTSIVNFDPSVEAHLRLGVDPRHADQMVRGTVVLPHGTGKVVRVAVFAQGEKAQEALRAGADEVGGEDLVKKIEAGWLEFDVAVATPDMMGMVGKLGRILGRRGLMPNPKAGHDHVRPRARHRRGQGRPRRVQGRQGRRSSTSRSARRASTRPRSSRTWPSCWTRSTGPSLPAPRATYLKGLTIASTMSPGVRVDIPACSRSPARPEPARLRRRHAPEGCTITRRDGREARRSNTKTDRRRQPAPADRAPAFEAGATVGA